MGQCWLAACDQALGLASCLLGLPEPILCGGVALHCALCLLIRPVSVCLRGSEAGQPMCWRGWGTGWMACYCLLPAAGVRRAPGCEMSAMSKNLLLGQVRHLRPVARSWRSRCGGGGRGRGGRCNTRIAMTTACAFARLCEGWSALSCDDMPYMCGS